MPLEHARTRGREREKKREIERRQRIFGYSHDGDVYWLWSRNITRRKRISMSGRGTRNRTSDSLFLDNFGTLRLCGTLLFVSRDSIEGDITLRRKKKTSKETTLLAKPNFLSFQRFPSSLSLRGEKKGNAMDTMSSSLDDYQLARLLLRCSVKVLQTCR